MHTNQRVFLFSTIFTISMGIACEYKPFELEVITKPQEFTTRGATRGISEPQEKSEPLKFATSVVKDANMVQSDAPFERVFTTRGSYRDWQLDPHDSEISKQNTMLEMYGYFKDFLGAELPNDFLSQQTMAEFKGLSIGALIQFPDGMEAGAVSAAVLSSFGQQRADEIFAKMKEKNKGASKFGVPYFSRPSVLSSKQTADKLGDSTLLACLSIAYASDLYKNPRLKDEDKVQLRGLGMAAMRSLIQDRMASEAINLQKNNRPVTTALVLLGGGNISCRLRESTEYQLKPIVQMRCLSIVQSNPILRAIPGTQGDRMVQVGDRLYETVCDFGVSQGDFGSNQQVVKSTQVSLTSQSSLEEMKPEILYGALKEGFGNSDLGKEFKNNLHKIQKADGSAKDFILSAEKKCDEVVTGQVKQQVSQAPVPEQSISRVREIAVLPEGSLPEGILLHAD